MWRLVEEMRERQIRSDIQIPSFSSPVWLSQHPQNTDAFIPFHLILIPISFRLSLSYIFPSLSYMLVTEYT